MARLTKSSYVKISLIALLCLLICGSITGAFAFVHNAMDSWTSSWDHRKQSWLSDANVDSGSFALDASTINDITISWLAGKVKISAVDDAETNGLIQVKEPEGTKLPLRWRSVAGKLEIDYGSIHGMSSCSSILHWDGKDLEVLIPKSKASSLGVFTLEAASGDYDLAELGCKTLVVSQASGNINFVDASAENASFEIASGKLSYDGKITNKLDADQASGSLRLQLDDQNPSTADLSLASGECFLSLPTPNFRLDLDKMSGGFGSDFQLLSNNNTYYCDPTHQGEENGEGSDHAEQSKIDMDMVSGNFYIART